MRLLVRWILVFSCVAGIGTSVEAAQTQPQSGTSSPQDPAGGQAASPPAAQQPVEDELQLRLVEPDFTVVNLPTTLRLPKYKLNFRLTHRFLGNLRQGSFTDQLDDLFGLDNGAIIGLELRFAPIRHLQAIVYRNNLAKTIQFTGQYDWIQQGSSSPVSLSGIVSIEGTNNFRVEEVEGGEGEEGEHDHSVATGHRSPALGGIVSRTFSDRLAAYAVPMWVHHVIPDPPRDTFYIGVGGRARISRNVYLVGEVSPRVNGFAAGDAEYAFGIERRAGGHMFQLTFTNALGSTYGQIGTGGSPGTLYLGFNLGRKFY